VKRRPAHAHGGALLGAAVWLFASAARAGTPGDTVADAQAGDAPAVGAQAAGAVREPRPEPDRGRNYYRDERGRSMRVRFDPDSRWYLGGGWAPALGLGESTTGTAGSWALDVGTAYRHAVDFADEGIAWKIYHRALSGRVLLAGATVTELDLTAYRGRFMRWTADGRVLLPTSPPRRVPFPLDIGLDATLGRLRLRDVSPGAAAEIGVLHANLLVDPWRRRPLGSYSQLGIGPRYDVRLGPEGTRHLVAPFTAGTLGVHHESDDGRHSVEATVVGGVRLEVEQGWAPFVEATTSYELVWLAVNDSPLSLLVDGRYRYDGSPLYGDRTHALCGVVGLRLGLPLTP
jgi:hypothetical protein